MWCSLYVMENPTVHVSKIKPFHERGGKAWKWIPPNRIVASKQKGQSSSLLVILINIPFWYQSTGFSLLSRLVQNILIANVGKMVKLGKEKINSSWKPVMPNWKFEEKVSLGRIHERLRLRGRVRKQKNFNYRLEKIVKWTYAPTQLLWKPRDLLLLFETLIHSSVARWKMNLPVIFILKCNE